jgi:hypothetical protein
MDGQKNIRNPSRRGIPLQYLKFYPVVFIFQYGRSSIFFIGLVLKLKFYAAYF